MPGLAGLTMDTKDLKTLLDEYQKAVNVSFNDAMTTLEIAEKTGWTHRKALIQVRTLCRAGFMELAGKKTMQRIDGSAYHVPAYKIIEQPKKKK